jgi:hypothetical protein
MSEEDGSGVGVGDAVLLGLLGGFGTDGGKRDGGTSAVLGGSFAISDLGGNRGADVEVASINVVLISTEGDLIFLRGGTLVGASPPDARARHISIWLTMPSPTATGVVMAAENAGSI